jgi:hypothetical protein
MLEAMKLIVQKHFGDSWRTEAVPPTQNGHPQKRGAVTETGITKAIEAVVTTMTGEVDWRDVNAKLAQTGYEVRATNVRNAVNRVLRKLVDRGLATEGEKGKGDRPSRFVLNKPKK